MAGTVSARGAGEVRASVGRRGVRGSVALIVVAREGSTRRSREVGSSRVGGGSGEVRGSSVVVSFRQRVSEERGGKERTYQSQSRWGSWERRRRRRYRRWSGVQGRLEEVS